MNIKKLITTTIFTAFAGIILSCPKVYAKENLAALQNGTFLSLSEEDKKDTICVMAQVIAQESGVTRPFTVVCDNEPNSIALAYNSMTEGTASDVIHINMKYFSNSSDAKNAGETVEHYLVKTIAHEVRHTYQLEHINDNTEFGRSVRFAKDNYTFYSGDYKAYIDAYDVNFLENDAKAFGTKYADKYVKNGYVEKIVVKPIEKTAIVAVDGKIFDAMYYYLTYPDVGQAVGRETEALLNHYNTFGYKEGRTPSAGA